jgi:hypothetical protein
MSKKSALTSIKAQIIIDRMLFSMRETRCLSNIGCLTMERSCGIYCRKLLYTLIVAYCMNVGSANALEGGLGAYLLGGRDTLAGVVPGPGTYVTNTFYYLAGKAPTLSLGGIAVADPKIAVGINKLDLAHFFGTPVLGGTAGLVLSVPYAFGNVSADGVVGRFAGSVKDTNNGFADLAATGLVGWHQGDMHYNVALTVFAPTASYNLATISLGPPPMADHLLNFSKNRFAFVPAVGVTYLNPKTGFELSGSLSLETSLRNTATDWQTAPILNFETAALQHLANGIAIGIAGYASQQLGEDSGTGAVNFRNTVGAKSLEARVFGAGPILTYMTKVNGKSINMKLKYSQEFEARRRFESNVVTGSVGVSF